MNVFDSECSMMIESVSFIDLTYNPFERMKRDKKKECHKRAMTYAYQRLIMFLLLVLNRASTMPQVQFILKTIHIGKWFMFYDSNYTLLFCLLSVNTAYCGNKLSFFKHIDSFPNKPFNLI